VKDQIARSVRWLVWSRVTLQIVSFLSTMVVVRLLHPADFGLMALASIWTNAVAVLAELGLSAAVIQFPDLEDRELNACFWSTLCLAVFAYLALYAAAPLIATWFVNLQLGNVLRLLGLTLPLLAIRIVPDGLLRKRLELDKVSRIEMASGLLTIPVVVGMAWFGAGVWALIAAALMTQLTQSTMSFVLARWWPGLRSGGPRFWQIFRYSLATLGTRLCWVIYEQADAFVLGKVSGDISLGYYSMAKQLVIQPVEKIAGLVNQLASPVLARLQADREAMRSILLRSLRLVAWASFPACIGLLSVTPDVVQVVLSDKWMAAVPIIRVLCLYALLRSIAVLLPPVLMARYRAGFLFGYNSMLLVTMPLAFWGGAVVCGGMGVAVTWIVLYPLLFAWMARKALHEVRLPLRTFLAELGPPAAATCAMLVVVLTVHWTLSLWGRSPAAFQLATVVFAGAAAYGLGLLYLGGPVRREIQEAVVWVFRRDHKQPTPKP
jgi:O-antigen/teichoic acid export membrane protein